MKSLFCCRLPNFSETQLLLSVKWKQHPFLRVIYELRGVMDVKHLAQTLFCSG